MILPDVNALLCARRVFERPLPIGVAVTRGEGWLARPNVVPLVPGSRWLELALALVVRVGAAANLTTDVQIAAHAIEVQGEVFSNDTDFERFEGVRVVNPFART